MEGELRDIKPLIEVPLGPPWGLIIAGVGIVLALLILAFWLWRRRARFHPAAALASPYEAAMRDLEAVRPLASGSADDRRRFHFGASAVLRAYVEARFGLNATDLTTEEMFQRLAESSDLSSERRAQLKQLLVASDGVKFARQEPSIDACLEYLATARHFIEATLSVAAEPAA